MGDKLWYSNRIEKLLLVFNLILLIKSISASYTASYLSVYRPKELEHYMNTFQIVPIFFLISFILIALPLFFKGKPVQKWCDWSSIIVIVIGIIYIYFA